MLEIDVDTKLEGFVAKEDGKFLVADAQITKLAGLANIKTIGANLTLSEDGTLAGKVAAKEVQGIHKMGVYVYMKHAILNDQEKNREGVNTWANEQTIRENYLKPFQIAIEEADAENVMTGFNRIGVTWTSQQGFSGTPRNKISPVRFPLGVRTVFRCRSRVVFPLPEEPMMASTWPRSREKLISFSTRVVPKSFLILFTSSNAMAYPL